MEEQKSIFELNLTEEGKINFSSIARWAFINAITAFVSLGLSLITTFFVTPKLIHDPTSRALAQGAGIFTFLIMAGLTLLINIPLINSANNLKNGLTTSDQGYFNLGVSKLATYFKILGILMIVFLVIFFLVILIGIMAGVTGRGMR